MKVRPAMPKRRAARTRPDGALRCSSHRCDGERCAWRADRRAGLPRWLRPTTMPYMRTRSPGLRSTSASLCLAGMFCNGAVGGRRCGTEAHDCSSGQRRERNKDIVAGIDLQNGFRHGDHSLEQKVGRRISPLQARIQLAHATRCAAARLSSRVHDTRGRGETRK